MYQSKNDYLKKRKKENIIISLSKILIILTFTLIWQIFSDKKIINPFIYSSPLKIINTILNLIKTNNFFIHIFTTLREIFISFIIGNVLAIIISIFLYNHRLMAKIIDPFLTIINSLPKVALGPIIIILFGANEKSIIIMALLINLIVSIITIYNGFLNTSKIKIKMFNTFNASKKDILYKLIIPENITTIISSLKLSISLTLIGVISGEFLVSKKGIGYLIIYGSQIFDLNLVLTGLIILLFISYLIYKLVILLDNKKSK